MQNYAESDETTQNVNLDALSKAVAMHETHDCADQVGSALVNNCHGIIRNGGFVRYNTPEESHEDFKDLWLRVYGDRVPTLYLAQIYSGNDRAEQWLSNVLYFYEEFNQ